MGEMCEALSVGSVSTRVQIDRASVFTYLVLGTQTAKRFLNASKEIVN